VIGGYCPLYGPVHSRTRHFSVRPPCVPSEGAAPPSPRCGRGALLLS
jgi:hypothetical protein